MVSQPLSQKREGSSGRLIFPSGKEVLLAAPGKPNTTGKEGPLGTLSETSSPSLLSLRLSSLPRDTHLRPPKKIPFGPSGSPSRSQRELNKYQNTQTDQNKTTKALKN